MLFRSVTKLESTLGFPAGILVDPHRRCAGLKNVVCFSHRCPAYNSRTGRFALRVLAGEIGDAPFFGQVVAYWQRYGAEIETVEQDLIAAQAGVVEGAEDLWRLDRFTRALQRNVRERLEQTLERLQRDWRSAYLLLCEASVYRCGVPESFWLSHLDYWKIAPLEQERALDILRDRFLVEEVLEGDELLVRQHHLIRSVGLDHLRRWDECERRKNEE